MKAESYQAKFDTDPNGPGIPLPPIDDPPPEPPDPAPIPSKPEPLPLPIDALAGSWSAEVWAWAELLCRTTRD